MVRARRNILYSSKISWMEIETWVIIKIEKKKKTIKIMRPLALIISKKRKEKK